MTQDDRPCSGPTAADVAHARHQLYRHWVEHYPNRAVIDKPEGWAEVVRRPAFLDFSCGSCKAAPRQLCRIKKAGPSHQVHTPRLDSWTAQRNANTLTCPCCGSFTKCSDDQFVSESADLTADYGYGADRGRPIWTDIRVYTCCDVRWVTTRVNSEPADWELTILDFAKTS